MGIFLLSVDVSIIFEKYRARSAQNAREFIDELL
jgi:hypothetical protein